MIWDKVWLFPWWDILCTEKKENLLGAILQRVGLSSAFFGLVYGSVFGFEHALDPLYKSMGLKHKPLEIMDNTMVYSAWSNCNRYSYNLDIYNYKHIY